MKIKAIVTTTYMDLEKGWSYSESALLDLTNTAKNKPIYMDIKKDSIGVVESSRFEDGRVIIEAYINEDEDLIKNNLFLVPGGIVDYYKNGSIVQNCTAIQYTFTDKPGDKTLTPVEIIE